MFEFSVTADFEESLKNLEKSLQDQVKDKLRMLMKCDNPFVFAKIAGLQGCLSFPDW